MVMTACAQQPADSPGHAAACSELAKYNCQLPEPSPTTAAVPSDLAIVPVLIAVLPAVAESPLLSPMRRVVDRPAPVTFTPLHVPHTVLLI
jgi:hypothetical protein